MPFLIFAMESELCIFMYPCWIKWIQWNKGHTISSLKYSSYSVANDTPPPPLSRHMPSVWKCRNSVNIISPEATNLNFVFRPFNTGYQIWCGKWPKELDILDAKKLALLPQNKGATWNQKNICTWERWSNQAVYAVRIVCHGIKHLEPNQPREGKR